MPASPDFTRNAPGSAWWVRNRQECASDGWALLRDLQEVLHERLATSQPALAAAVEADPEHRGWDAPLLQAMDALATQYRAPTQYLAALRADLAAQRVGLDTLRVAIWLAEYSMGYTGRENREVYGIGTPTEVQVAVPFVPPVWGAPIPRGVEVITGVTCHPVTVVAPPTPPPLPPRSFLEDYGPIVLITTIFGGGLLAAVLTGGARTYAEERAEAQTRGNPVLSGRGGPQGIPSTDRTLYEAEAMANTANTEATEARRILRAEAATLHRIEARDLEEDIRGILRLTAHAHRNLARAFGEQSPTQRHALTEDAFANAAQAAHLSAQLLYSVRRIAERNRTRT